MQKSLIFVENNNNHFMTKEIKTATEKIKELNELGGVLTLHQKLHRAKLAIGKVTKNATNPHFKKAYADINALIDAVEPILLENGLLLLQPIQGNNVCTQIIDIDSGTMIESCMELPTNLTPQQMGSAITYFRRYTLQSSMSLQSVDDDAHMAEQAVKQPVKETLSADRFAGALTKIAAGEYTVEQLKSKFNLTKEQEAQL
jgi:hypothetical protein